MKYAIVLIISLLIGYFAGQQFHTNKQQETFPQSSTDSELDVNKIKSELQAINDTDIKEYLELKTMKKKYLKANDILAKIMVIFLADLGLRINPKDIEKVSSQMDDDQEEDSSCSPSTKETSCPSLSELARREGKQIISPPPAEGEKRDWQKHEDKLSDLSSENDIKKFLKDVEISNFFKEISTAKGMSNKNLNRLLGSFIGTLHYDDKSRRPSEISIDLEGDFHGDKFQGQYKITIKDADADNTSSSSGDNVENFKNVVDSEKALFIKLGGKRGYLQLYFINSGSTLVGHYYKQLSMASFKKEGTVRLQRK